MSLVIQMCAINRTRKDLSGEIKRGCNYRTLSSSSVPLLARKGAVGRSENPGNKDKYIEHYLPPPPLLKLK